MIEVGAVIAAAFEPDSGPVPGELHHFIEREHLAELLPLPAGYRPLRFDRRAGVLGIVTGVGAARAAASIMALGLDERFDLRQALWLITGVAGIDPARGSLGSVVLPEYIVDGCLTQELDAREIHVEWPAGKSQPYEQPRQARFNGDDGIVHQLNPGLIAWAHALARDQPLLDTANMAARRKQFEPAGSAHQPPSVLLGAELAQSTFWHGKLLRERARRWVNYQTEGKATYALTAMEDAGILTSLQFLAAAGKVDADRILIARAASNFDGQREGITAAESLAETKVATYSAYLPALENAWRVGHAILETWLAERAGALW